jgi:hypothetical protein
MYVYPDSSSYNMIFNVLSKVAGGHPHSCAIQADRHANIIMFRHYTGDNNARGVLINSSLSFNACAHFEVFMLKHTSTMETHMREAQRKKRIERRGLSKLLGTSSLFIDVEN